MMKQFTFNLLEALKGFLFIGELVVFCLSVWVWTCAMRG